MVEYRHSSYYGVLLYRCILSNAAFSKPKTALKFYLFKGPYFNYVSTFLSIFDQLSTLVSIFTVVSDNSYSKLTFCKPSKGSSIKDVGTF